MVDETSNVTTLGGIHNRVHNAEQVRAAYPLGGVSFLAKLSSDGSDLFANILDNHFIGCDGLAREQTPVVDLASRECELFAAILE